MEIRDLVKIERELQRQVLAASGAGMRASLFNLVVFERREAERPGRPGAVRALRAAAGQGAALRGGPPRPDRGRGVRALQRRRRRPGGLLRGDPHPRGRGRPQPGPGLLDPAADPRGAGQPVVAGAAGGDPAPAGAVRGVRRPADRGHRPAGAGRGRPAVVAAPARRGAGIGRGAVRPGLAADPPPAQLGGPAVRPAREPGGPGAHRAGAPGGGPALERAGCCSCGWPPAWAGRRSGWRTAPGCSATGRGGRCASSTGPAASLAGGFQLGFGLRDRPALSVHCGADGCRLLEKEPAAGGFPVRLKVPDDGEALLAEVDARGADPLHREALRVLRRAGDVRG